MNGLLMVGLCLTFAVGLLAIYGLHRLALWMEGRGYIYYLKKKPKGGGMMGGFVAFQKAIEPRAEHVINVSQVRHLSGKRERPGSPPDDDPAARP